MRSILLFRCVCVSLYLSTALKPLQVALLIIGSAGKLPGLSYECMIAHSTLGFGRTISFADDLKIPPGHNMSFKNALHIVSTDMIIPTLLPAWALNLTQRLRNVRTAMADLQVRPLFPLYGHLKLTWISFLVRVALYAGDDR